MIFLYLATPTDTTHGYIQFKTEQEAMNALYKCNKKTIPNSKPPATFNLNHFIAPIVESEIPPREYGARVEDLGPEIDDKKIFKLFADKYPSLRSARGK